MGDKIDLTLVQWSVKETPIKRFMVRLFPYFRNKWTKTILFRDCTMTIPSTVSPGYSLDVKIDYSSYEVNK